MSRINTNIASLIAIRHLGRNQEDLALRLHRLSTGLRINRGRDDPAGLIVSERLRMEIRAIQQAIDNSTRASNVITTAEGALNEVSALLLDLQALIVEASNEGGLLEEEVAANQLQIDSILNSIDRIANTTTFGSQRLLDGTRGYHLSGVPTAALASVSVFAARMPEQGTRDVDVRITQSAQTAQVSFIGNNPAGVSTTSATTVELRGVNGSEILSFASGTTLAEVATAINATTSETGLSAVISSPGGPGIASALLINSTAFGSDAFVSVSPISGDFISPGNENLVIRDFGQDPTAIINGQPTHARGLQVDVRGGILDARFLLTPAFATTLSAANFTIAGGGTLFQLGPRITPNAQVHLGFASVRTTQLGDAVTGSLHSLRTGAGNDLASQNFQAAQEIVEVAVRQIASYRGRLGNLQKNTIQTNINSQNIALENLTAAESVIRDADMAEELSALTRAQILVQSTSSTLQIANNVPNLVLSLLE
ncbi:MAG: flagellin [Kiloniellales bacterium]|nr:flagellin [Kiloniellales bacterium]